LHPLSASGTPATADNPAAFPWLGEQPLPQAMGDFDHRYYDYPEQARGIKVKENSVSSMKYLSTKDLTRSLDQTLGSLSG
jgi:hypothetical protein